MLDLEKLLKDAKSLEIDDISVDGMTGYGISVVINNLLGMSGIKPVRPQMIYNYLKSGRIDGIKGTHRVNSGEAEKFIVKFVATRIKTAKPSQTPTNPAKK